MQTLFQDHIHQLSKKITDILERNQSKSLLIHSGSLEYRFLDDLSYPFRVNPIFNYFVPLTAIQDCFIYFEAGKKATLYYYRPVDFWHEMAPEPSGYWVDSFDIKLISSSKEVFDDLGSKLKDSIYIGQSASHFSDQNFKAINSEPIINELHFIRAEKTAYEQACLREASRQGVKAHIAAEQAFRSGASEYEINQAFLNSLQINESDSPYSNIVALNQNAATLHYTDYKLERLPEEKRFSFLIDAGVSYKGYASDITRSYAYRNDEWAEICQRFDAKQQELVQDIKLDLAYTENHLKSLAIVAEILHDFEFISLNPEEILAKKISSKFYPHGVGHFLGLQVHDVGGFQKDPKGTQISPPKDHPSLRLVRQIKANHVFTIEPGMYFINPLLDELKSSENGTFVNWQKIDAFKKYGGIRIEDNICIHEDRIENMTRDAFNEINA